MVSEAEIEDFLNGEQFQIGYDLSLYAVDWLGLFRRMTIMSTKKNPNANKGLKNLTDSMKTMIDELQTKLKEEN